MRKKTTGPEVEVPPVPPDPALLSPEELLRDGSLTIEEAVAFSNIGETRLRERVAAGAILSYLDGTRRMVPKRALVLYLARQYLDHRLAHGG